MARNCPGTSSSPNRKGWNVPRRIAVTEVEEEESELKAEEGYMAIRSIMEWIKDVEEQQSLIRQLADQGFNWA